MTPAPGRHLDEAELIDRLDGVLADERRAHLDGCATCRDALADVTKTWAIVAAESSDVPEPPPFYWEQLSARIRGAVREEPRPRAVGRVAGLFSRPGLKTRPYTETWRTGLRTRAVAAVLTIAVVAGLVWRVLPGLSVVSPRTVLVSTAAGEAVAAVDDSGFVDIESDGEWALVRSVADALPDEAVDAAGIVARPGAAEAVALSLSPRERAALAEILRDEMARATAPESAS